MGDQETHPAETAAGDMLAAALLAADTPLILTNPRLPDNPIIAANAAFCALSGYAAQDLLGHNCRFMQCEETDPASVDQLRAAIAMARPVEVVLINRRRSGERFWNRLLIAPIFDTAGEVIYFFANQRDVTAERQDLHQLEGRSEAMEGEIARRGAEERRLRESQQAACAASWDWNPQTGAIRWSEGFEEVLGPDRHPGSAPPSDFDGWLARVYPEDRGHALAGAEAIRSGLGRFEYRVERRGGLRWLESIGRVLARDEAGQAVKATGIVIDVTERKAADSRARESEALFRAVSEATPTIVFVTDAEGRNTFISPQFIAFTGLSGAQLLGDGWVQAMAPEDRDGVLAGGQRSRASGTDFQGELRMRRHDGVFRWFLARAVPIRDAAGQRVTGWCGTITDIQEQVEAREELARGRTELERRIDERTVALTEALEALRFEATERARAEEALRQVQKMEAIGQLTGGIAHDFNNLLGAISGSMELLQARLGQGRAAEAGRYIEVVRRAVDRGTALTHRLLAFARRQALDSKPVEPDRLVGDMVELIRRTVGPQIAVATRLGCGRVTALCDANQLEGALLNLAINARDAMPGGGMLTLATSTREVEPGVLAGEELVRPGAYIEITVADTGAGMTAEVRQRAFDPFFTTKPVGQGTGLGLSQTYGFVRQSDGFVVLESEEGVGTTIRLLLPRHDAPSVTEAAAAVPAPEGAPAGAWVLVVEDEVSLRELLTESLEELGCRVLSAADGLAGLAIVRSPVTIDLLVTDVGLPGLNGRQLAEAARALRPGLPIMFITGYVGDTLGDGVEQGLLPGAEVLAKPFTLATLSARLSEILRQRERAADAA